MAALMYKKLFLDDARSEGLSESDLEIMKNSIIATMDFTTQGMLLLKRKGDIITKIFVRQNKSAELLGLVGNCVSHESVNGRQFAMYLLEVLADCHLAPEQITSFKDSFMGLFGKSLVDREITVRVAALKATISFLTSIDDTDVVMQYAGVLP